MITSFFLSLFLPLGLAHAEEAPAPTSGRVVSVYDGDTMTLESGDKIRLRWINTPELRPPEDYGIEAREAAKALIMGQVVQLELGPVKRDGYGRLIAAITIDGVD
ncbi:MAG: thermonuclease family protein, partial [Myxococcota bacterium]